MNVVLALGVSLSLYLQNLSIHHVVVSTTCSLFILFKAKNVGAWNVVSQSVLDVVVFNAKAFACECFSSQFDSMSSQCIGVSVFYLLPWVLVSNL